MTSEDADSTASVAAEDAATTQQETASPVRLTPEQVVEFLAAEPLARAALVQITPAGTIGDLVGHEVTDSGAVLLKFACLTHAYTGWLWTAAVARATPEDAPTVLEVELLPGPDALVSPPWRPWEERYTEYLEHLEQTQKDEAAEDESVDYEESQDPAEDPESAQEPAAAVSAVQESASPVTAAADPAPEDPDSSTK